MSKLTGKVTVHGSHPARSATVEVINATGDVVDQVQADEEGSFTFHLSAGRWTLNLYDPHGHRGREEVELGEDDHSVTIDLQEPAGGH